MSALDTYSVYKFEFCYKLRAYLLMISRYNRIVTLYYRRIRLDYRAVIKTEDATNEKIRPRI